MPFQVDFLSFVVIIFIYLFHERGSSNRHKHNVLHTHFRLAHSRISYFQCKTENQLTIIIYYHRSKL